MHQQSDHLIRPGTAAWDADYPGLLVTEWGGDEKDKWAHPVSLVFVDDAPARDARVMSTTLATHQKAQPLLPYWSFGVVADGDCMVRCAAMADVACKNDELMPIIDEIISCGRRDPVFFTLNVADTAAREREKEAIKDYRELSATHAQRASWARLSQCAVAHDRELVCAVVSESDLRPWILRTKSSSCPSESSVPDSLRILRTLRPTWRRCTTNLSFFAAGTTWKRTARGDGIVLAPRANSRPSK